MLYNKIGLRDLKDLYKQEWAENFNSTYVWTERVIGYYSRRFKGAETRYSAMECKALAAKEGLIRFQPFIEGEKITLVTDHAALQWARTYENSNRRLTAWGTVFSAYTPHLEIVHRPGRKHSNVDPLSQLPRAAPDHFSPLEQVGKSLEPNNDLAEAQENAARTLPAKHIQAVWSMAGAFATTWRGTHTESQSSSTGGDNKEAKSRQSRA